MVILTEVLPRFPAQVLGSNGVKITKTGLTYVFGLDYTAFSSNPNPPANSTLLTYDPTGQIFSTVSYSALIAASAAASFPSQTGNAGKYLSTDGTNVSWNAPPYLGGTLGTNSNVVPVTNGTSGNSLKASPVSIADVTGNITGARFDTGGTGNSLLIGGVAVTANNGTGAIVRDTSPTINAANLGTPASIVLTNGTGLPVSTGISGLATGAATFLATPTSANLSALMTDETGTGANVFSTSPTLVTPALGTPSSVTLTNATGLPIATGVSGLATGAANFLASPTSANLISLITDETGSGFNVFSNSPTLVTPALGTPTSLVLTNATGLPEASVLKSAWTDWSGSIGFTGFSANPTGITARYKVIGSVCHVNLVMTAGTSNATTFTVTGLPVAAAGFTQRIPLARIVDNGAQIYTADAFIGGTQITMVKNSSGSGWTASGGKGAEGTFFYEIA